jgi:hypothetical protein
MTVKPTGNHQQSADLCDQLHLTARQKQMCVQGGDGLAETLLEGQLAHFSRHLQIIGDYAGISFSFDGLKNSHSHVRVHMSAAIRVRTMELHTTRPLAYADPEERSDIASLITFARALKMFD